ncbi:MAG: hypothetical protein RBU37_12350 [Myxococcota bacterium]|jgi:hypothetical protein|nr:hypothetical protein [Myxococcota bacterium]
MRSNLREHVLERPVALIAAVLLCVVLVSGAHAQDEGDALTERYVDFIWLEGQNVWKDQFRVKLSPERPQVDQTANISVRIRRTRNGKGQADVQPLKALARIGRESGPSQELLIENPGASFTFQHRFQRPGTYLVSVVTYYGENETYTVGLRFDVAAAPVALPAD